MAVAFDAVSESHTGTTGSQSEASFSWTHTPVGTPMGVIVFVFQLGVSTDAITSVSYGGTAMSQPFLIGGGVSDSSGEPGRVEAFFLGSSVPTGAQSIVVTRTNNTTILYAGAISVTASANTELNTSGIIRESDDQALTEENVDSGGITNALRVAGIYSGSNSVLSAGANSIVGSSIDIGNSTAHVVYESSAGVGSRPVGVTGASDDVAALYVAIRELVPTITDVETDEDFVDGDTNVTISGTDFSASGNVVELADSSDYSTANKQAQTITSEGTTSINFTAVLGSLTPGALFLFVKNTSGQAGFRAVSVHRSNLFTLSASANITASGENTTAQLTAPSGKTTSDFVAGRLQDDENPSDAIDITPDDYTELEWSILSDSGLTIGDIYEFRLVKDSGINLNTYTNVAEWEIGNANTDWQKTASATLSTSGAVARLLTARRTPSNSGTVSFVISRTGSSYIRTDSNSRSGSQSLARSEGAVRPLSNSGTIDSDLVRSGSSYKRAPSNARSSSFSVARGVTRLLNLTNSRSSSFSMSRAGSSFLRTVSNTRAATFAVSGFKVVLKSLSNDGDITADLARIWSTSRTASNEIDITADVTRAATYKKSVSNSRAFATGVVVRALTAVRALSNSRSSSFTLSRIWSTHRTASNTRSASFVVARSKGAKRSVSAILSVLASLSRAGSDYARSVSRSGTITASLEGLRAIVRTASNTRASAFAVVRIWTGARIFAENFTTTGNLSRAASTFKRSQSETETFSANTDATKVLTRERTFIGTFSGVLERLVVNGRALSNSISTSLSVARRGSFKRGVILLQFTKSFIVSRSVELHRISSNTQMIDANLNKGIFRALSVSGTVTSLLDFAIHAGRRLTFIGTFAASIGRISNTSEHLTRVGTFSAKLQYLDGFARVLRFGKDTITRFTNAFGITDDRQEGAVDSSGDITQKSNGFGITKVFRRRN